MGAPKKEIRLASDLSEPISHYTDAVLCGDYLFMSGAGPFDVDLNLIGLGDVEVQATKTLENINLMLETADMSFDDVAYWLILLDNVRDQAKVDAVFWKLTRKIQTRRYLCGCPSACAAGHADRDRRRCLQAA